MNPSTLIYCRPGFEKECAQEVANLAAEMGVEGYVKSKPDSGHLLYVPHEENGATRLLKGIQFARLTFPRQIVHNAVMVSEMSTADRVTPIVEMAATFGKTFSSVVMETADTNEAKELSSFCRKVTPYMEKALRKRNLLVDGAENRAPRLHVFFLNHATAYVGISDVNNSSAWPMGIPRLKTVHGAPSRSAQKLVEALHVFLTPEERAERMHEGITGVDLGAAPGGWTWVLLHHGLQVTAIDNGPLAPNIAADHRVEHLRVDGLHWRPKRPVHWLVCDMAERPARVAAMIADWVAEGHCQAAIFNLKLPMKKRYEEVELCRDLINERLEQSHIRCSLDFRQLYHDREEVTAYLRPVKWAV